MDQNLGFVGNDVIVQLSVQFFEFPIFKNQLLDDFQSYGPVVTII